MNHPEIPAPQPNGHSSNGISSQLADLADCQYVSLETNRSNGTSVATPVWVALLGGRLVVVTARNAFKVQRISSNPNVRMAACDRRGGSLGTYVAGTARIVETKESMQPGLAAIQAKYGWKNAPFRLMAMLSRKPRVIVEVVSKES